ncbi:MAG TPA: X-Pro dipeptidyl-peptidase [Planctomycetaceae bacterium]|nr:X-Pro dipeptidyl-peptidase [Planctomycetaceae bacterium]
MPGVDAQESSTRADRIRASYTKYEAMIPMRDGVRLYTSYYVPNDAATDKKYPMLMVRTPYSAGPYGADQYRSSLGPNEAFEESKYIFVFQDVRGKYLSEGLYDNMRPQIARTKPNGGDVATDESTDTFDTIEWLVNNVQQNSGRVGQWGISYPGFYTSAGTINSHPALKAASPQAPIADWFWDDMHRNGAFNVQLATTFFSSFGKSRPEPTVERSSGLDFGTDDAYQFFLDLGPLKNVNERHFGGSIAFWNDIIQHPNYDAFWQSRNILPHLKNVNCAVLVVGGWYDTEDLYGPLETYAAIERQNPNATNNLVMGPWYHGGWNRSKGDSLGDARFDWPTAEWYRDQIEFPFFEHHLKDAEAPKLAEATVFETGANRWRAFDNWPPEEVEPKTLFLDKDQSLSWAEPTNTAQEADWYISDPAKPVPYTTEITARWSREYIVADQRFAARRPDVLVYRSDPLEHDVTIAGPLTADMWFRTTGSDADLVVKLIDEFPGRLSNGSRSSSGDFQSGRQQLVRGQVMRLRFRDSFEEPKPIVPGEATQAKWELHDILHTFKRGHRIMIQVQSTWFPFVDRNPQTYVENIFEAGETDFVRQEHEILRGPGMRSRVRLTTLPNPTSS